MKNEKRRIRGRDDVIIDTFAMLVSLFVLIITLYPMLFVISASISDPNEVALGNVVLLPKNITWEGYRLIFDYSDIWIGYRNSFLYTVIGTLISVMVTLPAAYSFSRKDLPGGKAIMLILYFSGYVSGGLIPTYLAIRSYGLLNTPVLMVILGAVNLTHMLMVRTYFSSSIPEEMQEAALIDGCSYTRLLFTIMIPLSAPIIAVIALYKAVGEWNSYFNAMIYLTKKSLYPLQVFLRNILILNDVNEIDFGDVDAAEDLLYRMQLKDQMKYGLIIISSIPMLIMYPFVQKFFVKGAIVGAIKG